MRCERLEAGNTTRSKVEFASGARVVLPASPPLASVEILWVRRRCPLRCFFPGRHPGASFVLKRLPGAYQLADALCGWFPTDLAEEECVHSRRFVSEHLRAVHPGGPVCGRGRAFGAPQTFKIV